MLGHEAMKKMGLSNVLIAGMKGLGVEVGEFVHCNCREGHCSVSKIEHVHRLCMYMYTAS